MAPGGSTGDGFHPVNFEEEEQMIPVDVQLEEAVKLLQRWEDEEGCRELPPDPHDPGECVDCDTIRFLSNLPTS
jgi:hypothetical protein